MPKNPFISTLVFATLSFIPAAAGIFLLPLYLQKLSSEEFAILNLVSVFASLVAMFGNLKLDASIRTYYFDFEEGSEAQNQYLKKIFSLSFLLIFSNGFLLALLGPFLFSFIFKSQDVLFYPYGFYAVMASLLALIRTPYMIFLKNRIQLREFALYSLGEFGLIILLQAILILNWDLGLTGALLGLLIGQVSVSLIFLLLNVKLFNFNIKKEDYLPSLKYALLLLPFVLMNWMLVRGDRILFERLSNLEEVAKYALLMAILGLSRFIFNALDNAIRPFLFPLFKEVDKHKQSIGNYHNYYVGVSCIFLSALIMLGHLLPLFTQKENYLSIMPYFSLGALALLPSIWVRMYNLQLVFAKKSQLISLFGIIQFLVLILGFVYGVPAYGIFGALSAIGLSNLVAMFIFVGLARRYSGLKIPLFQGKSLILITAVFVYAAYFLNQYLPDLGLDFEIWVFPMLSLIFGLRYFPAIKTQLLKQQGTD